MIDTSNYSPRLRDVLMFSHEESERLGNSYIGPEHALLGIMRDEEGPAMRVLRKFYSFQMEKVRKELEYNLKHDNSCPIDQGRPLTKEMEKVLMFVPLEARLMKKAVYDTDHLLLAILRDTNLASQVLSHIDINYSSVKELLENTQNLPNSFLLTEDDDEAEEYNSKRNTSSAAKDATAKNGNTTLLVLNSFGKDLTQAAEDGKLDPVVGRDAEIERVSQILSRRKKNNPILIGEPGVGKSAIVEGLALRIVQKKVSHLLLDKRIFTLDMASVVAGTKYRGQFEERIKAILNELSKNPNVILFIDEIHTIIGAGSSPGSLDAANMLKPALARGEIHCIGATTLDEYRKHIEKDGALERRFQKVLVEPTSQEDTLTILHNIKERYEEHHAVKYTDEALKACVTYTDRYISDRAFPDKAIDALDEAGARTHISTVHEPDNIAQLEADITSVTDQKREAVKSQDFELATSLRDRELLLRSELNQARERWLKEQKEKPEVVDDEMVMRVVSMMSGVPIQRMAQAENEKLLGMRETLMSQIIGQDDAIEKIVKAILRNRIGLKDPNRPIGSFIFLGPTGVGKTHLAKILAKEMFNSVDAMIRIDMSEYMEKFSVSRLIGAPPGYVGYEQGGQLTELVRRKPYSIILLDEIEKAHPDVFNLLLQVLDEGRLTDSLGRRVDFKNTIVIMTSNVGTRQLKDFGKGVGFSPVSKAENKEYAHGVISKAINKTFSPEFLNRIDDIIMFDQLSKETIGKIIDIELKDVYARVEGLGYHLILSDEARTFIAEKGYDVQYGARPLKRAIQKYVEDEMAEILLSGKVNQGDVLEIVLSEDGSSTTCRIAEKMS